MTHQFRVKWYIQRMSKKVWAILMLSVCLLLASCCVSGAKQVPANAFPQTLSMILNRDEFPPKLTLTVSNRTDQTIQIWADLCPMGYLEFTFIVSDINNITSTEEIRRKIGTLPYGFAIAVPIPIAGHKTYRKTFNLFDGTWSIPRDIDLAKPGSVIYAQLHIGPDDFDHPPLKDLFQGYAVSSGK